MIKYIEHPNYFHFPDKLILVDIEISDNTYILVLKLVGKYNYYSISKLKYIRVDNHRLKLFYIREYYKRTHLYKFLYNNLPISLVIFNPEE